LVLIVRPTPHLTPFPTRRSSDLVQFASSQRLSGMLRDYIGDPLFSRSFGLFCLASLLVYLAILRKTLRAILKPLNEASAIAAHRSEEHTSELQSRENIVCRLLLE